MVNPVFTADPAPQVAQTFRRIAVERMAGLPVCNEALQVEAVGFARRDDGHWLGALLAPWSISLLRLPGQAEGWVSAPEGRRLMIRYPAGEFAFLGGREETIGEYLSCPLIANMAQFSDQETARLTAHAVLIALFQVPPGAVPPPAENATGGRRGLLTLGQ
jgi:[NiFe] hydrogenase assembly HybE family chaperone